MYTFALLALSDGCLNHISSQHVHVLPQGNIDIVGHELSEGIWLSGKTLDCRPRDCEFDSPSHQLNLKKGDMYLFSPRKKCSCVPVGKLKYLVCHVWWAL